MAQPLPVTANNVACELFHRLYDKLLKEMYLVSCPPADVDDLALYLYAHDAGCELDITKCLHLKVTRKSSICSSHDTVASCSTTITDISPSISCPVVTITPINI